MHLLFNVGQIVQIMETTTFISSFVVPQAAEVPGSGSAGAVGGAHLRPRLLGPALLPHRPAQVTQYTVHSTQYTVHSTQYTALLPHRPAQVMDCWDWELGLPTDVHEFFSVFFLKLDSQVRVITHKQFCEQRFLLKPPSGYDLRVCIPISSLLSTLPCLNTYFANWLHL